MDAMIRIIVSILCFAWCFSALGQQMNWSRLTEDTLYYASEYLPDNLMVTPPGPGQVWDFRALRAPYALSRRIVVTGEKENNTYAHLINGKQSEAILTVSGKASQTIQVIEPNPVCPGKRLNYTLTPAKKPFYHGILGGSYSYKGKMQSTFAWPRDFTCQFKPSILPDSCRITITIDEQIIVDGEGTLYLPSEVNGAYRQLIEEKRTVKVETLKGSVWQDVTSKVPGLQLITYKEIQRFVSSGTGIPLVDIELKDDMKPVSITFKTHPLVTRIAAEEPNRPDVFAYPNPSFDVVRFQMSDLRYGKYKIRIFNILGVPVRELEIDVDHPRKTVSMDLGDLERGTYLYRLQDSFGRTIRTKRVVLIQP